MATPAFRAALKAQRDTIREEYEKRLADLEMERETIEEEKAQVDRYKQLLLKQRDIMIALTQRLNERDEQIMVRGAYFVRYYPLDDTYPGYFYFQYRLFSVIF